MPSSTTSTGELEIIKAAKRGDTAAPDPNGKTPLQHTNVHNVRAVAQLLRTRGAAE